MPIKFQEIPDEIVLESTIKSLLCINQPIQKWSPRLRLVLLSLNIVVAKGPPRLHADFYSSFIILARP